MVKPLLASSPHTSLRAIKASKFSRSCYVECSVNDLSMPTVPAYDGATWKKQSIQSKHIKNCEARIDLPNGKLEARENIRNTCQL